MSLDTAKKCVDWIFSNCPAQKDQIEISFIGGEPLLEFDLITQVVEYTKQKTKEKKYSFFAVTNGTVLTGEMKDWFMENKNLFKLGLSLDGNKDTHNHNRPGSFDKIDIEFFAAAWKHPSIKMTLSEYSLRNLADDIIFLHSRGFAIHGVNLFEGDFDWSKDEYIPLLVPQLKKLVNFYLEHDTVELCQMFGRSLQNCELLKKQQKRTCGMGHESIFFDVDGQLYPCGYVTPMTFSASELSEISKYDFTDSANFNDQYCIDNCYIYPVCSGCYGESYKLYKALNIQNKTRCKIQKLISLFVADLHSKRILKNRKIYDENTLYYLIEAIKNIRANYLDEYKKYFV